MIKGNEIQTIPVQRHSDVRFKPAVSSHNGRLTREGPEGTVDTTPKNHHGRLTREAFGVRRIPALSVPARHNLHISALKSFVPIILSFHHFVRFRAFSCLSWQSSPVAASSGPLVLTCSRFIRFVVFPLRMILPPMILPVLAPLRVFASLRLIPFPHES